MKLRKVQFYNRWNDEDSSETWCILGIYRIQNSLNYYQNRICFFGFEIRFIYKK
jgi:hypothetical protein